MEKSKGSARGSMPRERWDEKRARQALEEWRASGKKIAAFAREHGCSHHKLRFWRERLGAQDNGEDVSKPGLFTPMTIRDASQRIREDSVTVVLPTGVRIEFPNGEALSPTWLSALAHALGENPI